MKIIKNIYLLILLIVCILSFTVFPTYAKFPSDYITENDVVGLNLNFKIGISNIEEYEEIRVGANNHKAFNVEITNDSDDDIFYGIWYKMISPKENDNDIVIARVNSTEVSTSGDIASKDKKTVSLVVINKTNKLIKVGIGVSSSITSINDIEYLSGKYLITKYSSIPINKNASKYIQELYNEEDNINTVNIANNKDNPKIFLNSNSNILLDNNGEYRYYGSDPHNYVLFNNELWRIISVSSSIKDKTNMRVKIIRNNPLGLYSWDSSSNDINNGYGLNDWSKSDLMNTLNSLYFNSKSGRCYIDKENKDTECDFTKDGLSNSAKELIDKATFYLGGIKDSDLEKAYANDYYNAERKDITWDGYVGLMYASDYAYAVNNIVNDVVPYKYEYNNYNWLKLSAFSLDGEYTLSTISNVNNAALSINYSFGNITNKLYSSSDKSWIKDYVSNKKVIRPVVYLKDNVVIVDGIGTSDSPYTLR